MFKLGRKATALLLAAAVTVSTAVPAFAAGSPINGKAGSDTTVKAVNTTKSTATVNSVSSKSKKATIPAKLKSNGKTYTVTKVATGAIKKKYDSVTMVLNKSTKVAERIMKSKKAKKTKKIVVKAADNKKKLTASQFNTKAFKGYKGKIVVNKAAMTAKEYRKLVRKLRKGGFKGKIYRISSKTLKTTAIKTGAIKKKYDSVTLVLDKSTKVAESVMKSAKAKKTTKVVIKADGSKKLTASQFNKKAFKGYRGKIVVKKAAMSAKQYKKLVKKLRKGGFKGKIFRKK